MGEKQQQSISHTPALLCNANRSCRFLCKILVSVNHRACSVCASFLLEAL